MEESLIRECILHSPLALLGFKGREVLEVCSKLLPYSAAFETECNMLPNFSKHAFTSIPDIMDVNVDTGEQRFRIPPGIHGIICLYNISYQLSLNSELNPKSGNHYHTDFTDVWSKIDANFKQRNEQWVLKELDTWGYTGGYNKRYIANGTGAPWVRFNGLMTMEVRIGEMTFDYEVLIKRILHCQDIARRLKLDLGYEAPIVIKPIDGVAIIEYIQLAGDPHAQKIYKLRSQLAELEAEEIIAHETSYEEMMRVINNRVKTIR